MNRKLYLVATCAIMGFLYGGVPDAVGQSEEESISDKDPDMSTMAELNLEDLELNGSPVAKEVDPPEFLAKNSLDEDRTVEDLIGKPTVLWFFPFADTPG